MLQQIAELWDEIFLHCDIATIKTLRCICHIIARWGATHLFKELHVALFRYSLASFEAVSNKFGYHVRTLIFHCREP